MNKISKILFCALLICLFPGMSQAHLSVADVDGYPTSTIYVSYNYASQKEADNKALEGCRATAKKNGLTQLEKKCTVISRAKNPGYGALVCGDKGCSWSTAYDDMQTAVDHAYDDCSKSYGNCQRDNIPNWDDEAGFRQSSQVVAAQSQSCRPNKSNISCRFQCTNGSCIVTYENGCKMSVQVQPRYNPFTNQWEYPSPAC
jgi:hypothetical protein